MDNSQPVYTSQDQKLGYQTPNAPNPGFQQPGYQQSGYQQSGYQQTGQPSPYAQPPFGQNPYMYPQQQSPPPIYYVQPPPAMFVQPTGAGYQQVVVVHPPDPYAPSAPVYPPVNYRKGRQWSIACLVFFCAGLLFPLFTVISDFISMYMVRKRFVVRKKSAVLGCSVIELVAFVIFCWVWSLYLLIIWYVIILACGIPRVIFSWKFDGHLQAQPGGDGQPLIVSV